MAARKRRRQARRGGAAAEKKKVAIRVRQSWQANGSSARNAWRWATAARSVCLTIVAAAAARLSGGENQRAANCEIKHRLHQGACAGGQCRGGIYLWLPVINAYTYLENGGVAQQ